MISGDDLNKAMKNVFNFLDTFDLTEYIIEYKNKTVRELMVKLSDEYCYSDEYSSSLFDIISEDEFVEYLNNKYGLNIKETVIIRYYI